jgi:hypothetical protein
LQAIADTPDGVAVDVEAGHIYWTNMGAPDLNDGSIERADNDGKHRRFIFPEGRTFTPKQLHLDKTNGKLYWSDREGMRGEPLVRGCTLTLRAMSIAARVIGDLRVAALVVLAACDMAAERCRATVLDRRHHLELAEADMAGIGLAPWRSMAAENIRDLQHRTGHRR